VASRTDSGFSSGRQSRPCGLKSATLLKMGFVSSSIIYYKLSFFETLKDGRPMHERPSPALQTCCVYSDFAGLPLLHIINLEFNEVNKMPLNLPAELPAVEILNEENVFVMTKKRALTQDIRPLQIGIVNLMPTKIATETQLLRLLSNTPLQVEIALLQMGSHQPKNTSNEHMSAFYRTFDDIKNKKLDGLIITGAPVEMLNFDKVDYWNELCSIMEWSKNSVYCTMHICWGAQAGLFYHYGVNKYPLHEKLSGVYAHKVLNPTCRLMRGFDDPFFAPHSRHTSVREEDIRSSGLSILSASEEAGVYIAVSKNRRQIFVTGHSEYDKLTLDGEYRRDLDKGLNIKPPANYYQNNNPACPPNMLWRAHAHLLFSNWLNYYVYQETPFNLESL